MVQPATVREPLKFKPILQARIWGGDGLYRILGKGGPEDKDIGESWELSDRDHNASVVSGGAFAGQNLKDIYARHARDILGSQFSLSWPRFPLLYKFISARENLSVQVHPGPGSPLGEAKTECWYILDAPPGASLILGLSGEGDKKTVLAALQSKECQSALNRIPAKPGDLFFIPAGTVHAITAGMLLYEVQQNSDTTFRIYDWDRVDASGKSRPLHVQQSAQVIDFRRHEKHRILPLALERDSHREEFLAACGYFALVKLSRFQASIPLKNHGRFRVLTCVRGAFELWDDGAAMPIALGETVLLPAACPNLRLRETAPGSEIIASFIPRLQADVIAPLLTAGYSPQAIRDLGGIDGLRVDPESVLP